MTRLFHVAFQEFDSESHLWCDIETMENFNSYFLPYLINKYGNKEFYPDLEEYTFYFNTISEEYNKLHRRPRWEEAVEEIMLEETPRQICKKLQELISTLDKFRNCSEETEFWYLKFTDIMYERGTIGWRLRLSFHAIS